ncbi:hypothetical protein EJB05_25619, partial [Eragrostis curvula]
MKGVWKLEDDEAAYRIVGESSYRLFPEPGQTHHNMGINANSGDVGLNVQIQMGTHENNVHVSACGSALWFPSAPEKVQQARQGSLTNHGGNQSSYIPSCAPGPVEGSQEDFHDIMATQHAYLCALKDPDQITPLELLQQSPNALKHHYARDIISMLSGESSTNVVTQQPRRASRSDGVPQRTISTDALETATPEEIVMVYDELIPHARSLSVDVFGNYAVQKLLEHGPQVCKRKFIGRLTGHVLCISHDKNGSRVMQKAFEVADLDQQIKMANEFGGEAAQYALELHANHVIQKCIECVPSQHILLMLRSFRGKVAVCCTNIYGCHKMLDFCNDQEIIRLVVSEIIEAVVTLVQDQFGNYVVQHVVERGGPVERSLIVNNLRGRVVNLSYHRFASNVIECCITFGSLQDQQLMTTEILTAGYGQLLDMMCHSFANFVIKKVVSIAGEGPLRVLADVARCNTARIKKVQHGRHVLAHIEKVLADRAGQGMPPVRIAAVLSSLPPGRYVLPDRS